MNAQVMNFYKVHIHVAASEMKMWSIVSTQKPRSCFFPNTGVTKQKYIPPDFYHHRSLL